MSDEIQPVVPAESDYAVEQAAVAEVSAPSLEAELKEEILAEVQSELEKFPEDVFLSPDEVDALIDRVLKEKPEDEVVKVTLKEGHPDCIIPGGEGFVNGVVFEMTRARYEQLSDASFIAVVDERAYEASESQKEGL